MKIIAASLATLFFAAPALAQEWPKEDWRILEVIYPSASLPKPRDGGASPIHDASLYAAPRPAPSGPAGRETVALNLASIARTGDSVDVRYFVWSGDKAKITEVSSKIDCGRSGEEVTAWRQYGADFVQARAGEQSFRRVNATSRAVANDVCRASRARVVSDKSLPELLQDG